VARVLKVDVTVLTGQPYVTELQRDRLAVGMYKGGFAGKARFAYRYSFRPAVWERLLVRAGFVSVEASVLDAPRPGHLGTLIVRADVP
jgi:hypothetical protein